MVDRTEDPVEAVSNQVAAFIVDGLQWEGSKQSLLAPNPAELPAILDSKDLFELAGYLEQTFGIVIEDEEIVVDNFINVRRLARLVVDKKAGAGSG